MAKTYGGQSMVAPLKRVIVRKPDESFGQADPHKWHYTAKPDLNAALAEHQALVDLLAGAGVEVIYHQTAVPEDADAIFVHDPLLICDRGAILLQMGKKLRHGEPESFKPTLQQLDIPVHYQLSGDAIAEGGDLMWVDQGTLAVGIGYRTNMAGFNQLQEALPDVELFPVQLPYYLGPEACLHLMSTISMIDDDLAVVFKRLTSVLFLTWLSERGVDFVEVPEEEFGTMGPNVLAVGPRQCVMLQDNPITRSRLEAAGCEVVTYRGNEISLKAEGGATCLTRPILRETADT